jgi:hypothetical protein
LKPDGRSDGTLIVTEPFAGMSTYDDPTPDDPRSADQLSPGIGSTRIGTE